MKLPTRTGIARLKSLAVLASGLALVACSAPSARLDPPVLETPVLETPVLETPVLETPVLETPVLETPVPSGPVRSERATEADIQACGSRGGEMRREGRLQTWQCVTLYADAGKPCRDVADCEGDCAATPASAEQPSGQQTGICAVNSSPFGCQAKVVDGQLTPTRCVD